MQRVLFGIAISLLHVSMMVKLVLGLLLHVYTTYIAYQVSGLLAAILTFLTPGFAEVFWIVKILIDTHQFWTLLTIGCAAYIGVWIVLAVVAGIAAASEPR